MRQLLFLFLMFLLTTPIGAQDHRAAVNVPAEMDIDQLGGDVRRALNAWEAASQSSLPTEWTLYVLTPGHTTRIDRNVYMLVVESSGDAPRLLVVGPDGPTDATVTRGEVTTIGPLEVLLTQDIPTMARTEVLVRAAGSESQLFSDSISSAGSPTRITGIPGQYGNPGRITVSGPDEAAVAFARAYLLERLRGQTREGAALAARREVPPRRIGALEFEMPAGGITGSLQQPTFDYRDPVNMRLPPNWDAQDFHTAGVTLQLIRGSSEALRTLSSAIAYDSEGRTPDNPRVRAGTDRDGGADVRIGSSGDRWQARLRALEQSGEVRVESTTFLRVPLDGRSTSSFRFDTRQQGQSGALRARRMGTDAVELMIDTRSGDWSDLGAVNTRACVRDGGTVQLARSATTITRETRSGPPILGDIPYAGPLFGNSSRYNYESEYALFATVVME
jgi:hypothetical protein